MLDVIFFSDGKISDTDIPSRISKQIALSKNIKIRFFSLSIISILKIYFKFIIHIFNRYIAFGLQGTLFFLLSGALLVAVFEYIFRNIRSKILCDVLINPIKFFKLDLIKTFFERENKTSKRTLGAVFFL